jgi:tRNA (guanine-N(7)-)-methyltransferase
MSHKALRCAAAAIRHCTAHHLPLRHLLLHHFLPLLRHHLLLIHVRQLLLRWSKKHLTEKAFQEKEKNFWGVELYTLGVILAAKKVFHKDIINVSLLEGDARSIVEKSPKNFWQEIYVLFPDPWRKKKHFKRRILKQEFIMSLIEKTCAGGEVVLATDWGSYREEVGEALQKILEGKGGGKLSLSEKTYREKEAGKDRLILTTSFAERAFKEGREITVFKMYKK